MKAKPPKKTIAKTAKPAKALAKNTAPKAVGPKTAKSAKIVPPKAAAKPAVKPAAKSAAKPAAKQAGAAAKAPAKASAETKVPAKPKPRSPGTVASRRKEMQHFRNLLLDRQRDLMKAYKISKGDSQSHLDNGTEDYIDYAVNSYAKEFLLSLTELDRKQLLLVEEALRRIDRGEYGRCQQCGEDINRKRIEVAPWARHCVRCQELEEQGLLPQHSFNPAGDEIDEDEPEEAAVDDEFEAEPEADEEVLEEEPLVVDGDDSEE